jgi:exodeoxyribonuclease-5
MAPSRDEGIASSVMQPEMPGIIVPEEDDEPVDDGTSADVQGGRERGQIIHKLLEEVLTRETEDGLSVLAERAGVLIGALGQSNVEDPAKGLSSAEIAGCVARTLALPEIAALRPTLVPEFPVYASALVGPVEQATAGVTDATSFAADGKPQVVIDWKSDVDPAAQTIEHYRAQVRNYLGTMGIENGLIVFVTSGTVVHVKASVTVELIS